MKKQSVEMDASASQTVELHLMSPTTYLIYIIGSCQRVC